MIDRACGLVLEVGVDHLSSCCCFLAGCHRGALRRGASWFPRLGLLSIRSGRDCRKESTFGWQLSRFQFLRHWKENGIGNGSTRARRTEGERGRERERRKDRLSSEFSSELVWCFLWRCSNFALQMDSNCDRICELLVSLSLAASSARQTVIISPLTCDAS